MSDSARRAGQLLAARRRGRSIEHPGEDEWPELRREILAQGGIGPSRDWDSSSWPGDLYREHGKAPDLVAVETAIGRADVPPWGDGGNDGTMHSYLERAHYRHRQIIGAEKRGPADEEPDEEERPAAHRAGSHMGRREREDLERRAHEERISAFVRQARAARAASPRAPAIGFYTDRKDVVHPITTRSAQGAGRRYALRRGK